jgi:hypothetical protein
MPDTRSISAIKVGKRHRKDLGDLAALAESLEAVGLLHAVVIDSHDRLIAGRRRLAAAKLLGWRTVPVRVVDLEQIALGEFVENACRKDFTPSEIAGIAQALRPPEERKAHQRRLAGLRNQKLVVENFPHEGNGKTRDIVARYCGISGRTLDKIEAVVEAAEQDPDRYGTFKDRMDRTGKVHQPWQQLRVAQRRHEAGARRKAPGGDQDILIGAMGRLWGRLADGAADLFFTDPVYQDVAAYDRLAELAARKLKPGGLCLAYTGHLLLPEVLAAMGRHLRYWWLFAVPTPTQPKRVLCRHLQARWKPLVAFARPPVRPAGCWLADLVEGGARDQAFHDWGQGEPEAAYLIRRLTLPGDLVVDPYCGGGTVPAACKANGRRWLATEIDRATALLARRRLAAVEAPDHQAAE